MGLNDLIKNKEREAKVEFGDQTSLDEHEELKYGGPTDPSLDDNFTDLPYDREYKPCPHCGCKSGRISDRFWACPYDGCGVKKFGQGWNEQRSPSSFLGDVEIEGWEVVDW